MSVRKQTTKHKQDRNNKRQEATKNHNANKKDYTGYPSESAKQEEEKNKKENDPGYPRSSQQTNKVKNRFGFVKQAQSNKTEKEKVNLKGPKLRKTPLPLLVITKPGWRALCALPTAVLP
jgi:hypothetical protein